MKKAKNIVILIITLFSVAFLTATNIDTVHAAGGYIGTGTTSSSGGGGGSGSGGGGGGQDAVTMGTSWIFYKSTGNEAIAVTFVPRAPANYYGTEFYNETTIDKSCSEHSGKDENGGFWHYGRNGQATSMGTGYVSSSVLYGYMSDNKDFFPKNTYTYSTSNGKYGHRDTYTWGHTISYGDHKGQPYYQNHYVTNGELDHKIYKNGTEIYYAEKYASIDEAKAKFKIACDYNNRQNGTNHNCNDIWSNVNYFCYWDTMPIKNVSLSAKAVDPSGNYVDGDRVFDSSTVQAGNEASVGGSKLPSITGYKFAGWRKSKGSGGYASTGTTYKEKISSDTTIYAVYEKIKVTINAYAISTNKSTFLNGGNQVGGAPKTVDYGSSVSITQPGFAGYDFKGWYSASANSKDGCKKYSGSLTTSDKYTLTLKSNGTVCAVYQIQNRTLTAYAAINGTYNASNGTRTYLTSGGAATTDSAKSWTNSSTVNYGSTATVDTSSFNPTGYSWATWGSSCPEGERDDRKCVRKNLTSNASVIAYYDRNGFQARARVGNGTDWSKVTQYKSSGYVDEADSGTTSMDCTNANGCTIGFWFDLKTIKGTGSTDFTIETRSKPYGGSFSSWTAVSGYSGKTSTPATGGSNVYTSSQNVAVGTTMCYRIKYKPYGTESNSTYKYVTTCGYIKPSTFQGKSTVSGATSATAGYTTNNKSTKITGVVKDCSPISGCDVTIRHYLKRIDGAGSVNYTISRTSNYWVSTKSLGIAPNNNVKSGTFSPSKNNTETELNSATHKLYPGVVVCERLTFKPNNMSSTSNIYTEICASANGNAQPPDPADPDAPEDPDDTPTARNKAYIDIRVRNSSIVATSPYYEYSREVYAKPGDKLAYRAVYNPILQYAYYIAPQKMQIDGGTIYPKTGTNTTTQLWSLFNANKGSNLKNWNNSFNVYSTNFITSYSSNHNYTNGDPSIRFEINNYTVSPSEVGRSLNETAITNRNDTVKTTPSQVTFTDKSGLNTGNVITAAKSSIAYARIPYNFINTSEINNKNDVIDAGETETIKYDINVNEKTNTVTDGTYATKVDDAKWKIQVRINNESWQDTKEYTGTLTPGKNNKNTEINIPDVSAGTTFCVRIGVYPASSGANTNWSDKEGDHKWAYSPEKCFTIAKKPSLEVWGGNVYSRGKITTSVSSKTHVAGVTNYNVNITANTPKYIFGSFGELGTIAGGAVSGFASGAATGFTENSGDNNLNLALWPSIHPANGAGNNASIGGRKPGGSIETTGSFCTNRNPLTFANYPCKSAATGVIGNSIAANSAAKDKSSIISRFATGSDVNASGSITISNESENYNYSGNNDLIITSANLSRNASGNTNIKVVRSDKNITIAGDLIYDGTFTTLSNIPKLVVYADNIYIDCIVTRIDALLIANNAVVTCNNLGNATTNTGTVRNLEDRATDKINDEKNSNQLIVNGAIIADSITPNRTYGSATGANSIIPAEIINYDPSLYLWGGESVDIMNGGNSNLDITYIQEQAPRY